MSQRERWATFSVLDHTITANLIADLLLYDRLVIPYPASDDERKLWLDQGWKPDLLDSRIELMGENLVVRTRWDHTFQERWRARMKSLESARRDANSMVREATEQLGYQMTREVLRETLHLSTATTGVEVVAGYHSEADLKADFLIAYKPIEQAAGLLGLLLGHRLAVPSDLDPEVALKKVIDLASKNDQFKEHRRKLFEWQATILREGVPPHEAARKMDELIQGYNKCVEKAVTRVYYKFAACVASIGASFIGAHLGDPHIVGAALASIVSFALLDRQPVTETADFVPAAVFHDVSTTFAKFKLA